MAHAVFLPTSTYVRFETTFLDCLLLWINLKNKNSPKNVLKNGGRAPNSFYGIFRFFFLTAFGATKFQLLIHPIEEAFRHGSSIYGHFASKSVT